MKLVTTILIVLLISCRSNYIYEILLFDSENSPKRFTHNNTLPFDSTTDGIAVAYRYGILYDSGAFVNGRRYGFHKISRICVDQEFTWKVFFEDWQYTNENFFTVYFKDGTIYQVSAKLKDSIQHVVKIDESYANFQLLTKEFNETNYGTFINQTSTYVFFNLNYHPIRFRYKSRDGKIDTVLESKNLPYIRIRDNDWKDFEDSIILLN